MDGFRKALQYIGCSAALTSVMLITNAAWPATPSDEPERCVSLVRISSTEVLSNQKILFKLHGNNWYINALPYPCPGLRRDSTIMYRTSMNQLCDLDVVTVLQSTGGGYMPGASCGLGRFVPLDKDEVKALREAARKGD